jgi:type IV secretory pathway TrbL component
MQMRFQKLFEIPTIAKRLVWSLDDQIDVTLAVCFFACKRTKQADFLDMVFLMQFLLVARQKIENIVSTHASPS